MKLLYAADIIDNMFVYWFEPRFSLVNSRFAATIKAIGELPEQFLW